MRSGIGGVQDLIPALAEDLTFPDDNGTKRSASASGGMLARQIECPPQVGVVVQRTQPIVSRTESVEPERRSILSTSPRCCSSWAIISRTNSSSRTERPSTTSSSST